MNRIVRTWSAFQEFTQVISDGEIQFLIGWDIGNTTIQTTLIVDRLSGTMLLLDEGAYS